MLGALTACGAEPEERHAGAEAARLAAPLEPCGDVLAVPAPAPPHLRLVGAALRTDPFASEATLRDDRTGATRTLAVGESLGAIRLLAVSSVDRDGPAGPRSEVHAVVCNAGAKQHVVLDLGRGGR
jgi:hypothetical protein